MKLYEECGDCNGTGQRFTTYITDTGSRHEYVDCPTCQKTGFITVADGTPWTVEKHIAHVRLIHEQVKKEEKLMEHKTTVEIERSAKA